MLGLPYKGLCHLGDVTLCHSYLLHFAASSDLGCCDPVLVWEVMPNNVSVLNVVASRLQHQEQGGLGYLENTAGLWSYPATSIPATSFQTGTKVLPTLSRNTRALEFHWLSWIMAIKRSEVDGNEIWVLFLVFNLIF